MSNNFSSKAAALLFSFALVATLGVPECKADWKRLTEFRDILTAARRLESAEMLVDKLSADGQRERTELLYGFMRVQKSVHADKHYQQLSKLATDYRSKANQFLDDTQKQRGNWLTNIITLGGPLGAMRGMSKSEPFLTRITERYAEQAKSINMDTVDKDLVKFQIRGLDMILFVLAIDIKYLAIKDVQFLNIAIFDQLKADRFVASSDMYEQDRLSDEQKKLLREFYVSRVDASKVSVGEASEHFEDPGNLIIGRLLDSCKSLQHYQSEWQQLAPKCGVDCEQPTSKFSASFNLLRYADFTSFCGAFIAAQ